MKTWRERIQDARARGRFVSDDYGAWVRLNTCPAAEVALAYGVGRCTAALSGEPRPFYSSVLHALGDGMLELMEANDFDGCGRLLDSMEDRALQLKREGE